MKDVEDEHGEDGSSEDGPPEEKEAEEQFGVSHGGSLAGVGRSP